MKLVNPVGREATSLNTEANYDTRSGCTCGFIFMNTVKTDSGCGWFCTGDDDQLIRFSNNAKN